ncbi:MAG: hypothetical protein AB8B64_22800 [Granulosicoccus sp.]
MKSIYATRIHPTEHPASLPARGTCKPPTPANHALRIKLCEAGGDVGQGGRQTRQSAMLSVRQG